MKSQELFNMKDDFFQFMEHKYYLYHNSNVFLRDIQYAVRYYFEEKQQNLSYTEGEEIAIEFASLLEKDGSLKKLSPNTWLYLNKKTKQENEVESANAE